MAAIAALLIMGMAHAQINPTLFQDMQWRNIGPFIGGKVDSVSGVNQRGLLFAATETSVHVSFDDGAHWQSLRLNLPTTAFYDLKIHDGDLIAATYGRGIWILDDTSPLEQLTAHLADRKVVLFRPRAATRVQSNIKQDTPFPPELPHGQNPPQGVVIDYCSSISPSGAVPDNTSFVPEGPMATLNRCC